jgi:hypothetical protein
MIRRTHYKPEHKAREIAGSDRTEPKFKVPHPSRCIDEPVATPKQNLIAMAVALTVIVGVTFVVSKIFWWLMS